MTKPIMLPHKVPLRRVYANIYPWRRLQEFTDDLVKNIAYTSEDRTLVAVHKPFGVGIYTAEDRNSSKQNQDKLLYRLQGSPRYSLQDALKSLSEALNVARPLEIIKPIDRYCSGLVLLSTKPELVKKRVSRSVDFSRVNQQPIYKMRAIASGIPLLREDTIKERVGVKLVEIDELGDYKEPVVDMNPSRSSRHHRYSDRRVFIAELRVKKVNRELGVSHLDLGVSKMKWDFPRNYISSKTSFILGDVRFSKRIREILGKQIQVSNFKSSHLHDDGFEPLNTKLRECLGVYKNAHIPLMLDVYAINLRHFQGPEGKKDYLIQSPFMPSHFALTAERLNLLDLSRNNNDDDIGIMNAPSETASSSVLSS